MEEERKDGSFIENRFVIWKLLHIQKWKKKSGIIKKAVDKVRCDEDIER